MQLGHGDDTVLPSRHGRDLLIERGTLLPHSGGKAPRRVYSFPGWGSGG
jgi:hypothetical protein